MEQNSSQGPLELFEASQLIEAIAAQKAAAAADPGNLAEQLLLCDFLAHAGHWEEIRTLLGQIQAPNDDVAGYLADYQNLIIADAQRQRQPYEPEFLWAKPGYMDGYLKGLQLIALGEADAGLELIETANDDFPLTEGFVDGRAFEMVRDVDDFLAPVLEVFAGQRYVWVPFEQIKKLVIEPIDALRDQLYLPATLTPWEGPEIEVFLPMFYPGTPKNSDPDIQLGFTNDFAEVGGLLQGVGAKMFLFGEEELMYGDFSHVEFRR